MTCKRELLIEKKIELHKKIIDAYTYINNKIMYSQNNMFTRATTTIILRKKLPFLSDVKCDESNNWPEIIDMNRLVATIMWKEAGLNMAMNLTFGNGLEFEWDWK